MTYEVKFLSDGKQYTVEVNVPSRIYIVPVIMEKYPYAIIKSIVGVRDEN